MAIRSALFVILIFLSAGPSHAQTCNGLPADIVGTDADDYIVGTPGDDIIQGLGGNDLIYSAGGNDIVCGGDGDDDLYGNDGDDLLFGDAGNDILVGSAGNDSCDGVVGVDSAAADCETSANIDTRVLPVTLYADDGEQLDGALYVPTNDALNSGNGLRKTAMIVSHGAMGTFDNSVPKSLGLQAAPLGFTVLALNRRDWGPTGGGGAVLFEDATLDIGVGIDLLDTMGFESIYVAGHSQGTQNAGIYPSFTLDQRVAAVGMYGAVDDGRTTASTLLFPYCAFLTTICHDVNVALSEQLIADGQGDVVVPWLTGFGVPLFRSPRNYLSYWGPDSLSVLQREITNLTVPALLMRADGDDFTPDLMSQNVLAAGLAAGIDISYTVLDFPFPLDQLGGNAHGFVGVERAMMSNTFDWLTSRVTAANEFTRQIRIPREQSDGNFAPLADAGEHMTVSTGGVPVVLDATGSVDIDGEIASYYWFQGWGQRKLLDDPTSAQPRFLSSKREQTLYFILQVTDNSGAVDWSYVRVDVTDGQCSQPDANAPWSAWFDYWRCRYQGRR